MIPFTTTRVHVLEMLKTTGFAVLATENAGQPHTSLIAVTPLDEGRTLVFATYRNTRKFANLMQNPRVSVLMSSRQNEAATGAPSGLIVSAVGLAREINPVNLPLLLSEHLNKHPDLKSFVHEPDCALLEVVVEKYQVVRGIDDVTWWNVNDAGISVAGG